MAHCMPLLVRPRSAWILGAAIETIVWSMKVMATAKIIAVRISGLDRPPVVVVPTALIMVSQAVVQSGPFLRMGRAGPRSISQMTRPAGVRRERAWRLAVLARDA